ncbi:hypothetical protein [Lentisalinibacter orientalis]|uniref:hypothetical protein n=1 Tax=Lentisalinibacter orientalis TaxID=2992241 RepID=UPI003863395F
MREILRLLAKLAIAAVGLAAVGTLWLFLPVWFTPIAKFWYEPGFEEAVSAALKDIPDHENACIYDDTQNIFVTSVEQLDVGRMLEKAVKDRIPHLRGGKWRDPHFRIYANGRTYYWSFSDEEFHPFLGDRWTLRGKSAEKCDAYNRYPRRYQQVYEERYGIGVTEANFCCGSDY